MIKFDAARTIIAIFVISLISGYLSYSPTTNAQEPYSLGHEFTDCEACPIMVVVPKGSYMMGPLPGERPSISDNEVRSQTSVTIPKDFAVGKFEVTKGQFAAFVSATGYEANKSCLIDGFRSRAQNGDWRNPGFDQLDSHPVVCVNGNDADAYVSWISRITDKKYKLLSAEEWEYAARAGTTSTLYWGWFGNQCSHANGADSAAKHEYPNLSPEAGLCHDGYVHTSQVGRFQANHFGLHDMIGNTWEWTEECFTGDFSGRDCTTRILRGGSWASTFIDLRLANYTWSYIQVGSTDRFGFRIARALD